MVQICKFCPPSGFRSNNILVEMRTPRTKTLVSNFILQRTELKVLGEMTDSSGEQEIYQMSLECLVMPENEEALKKQIDGGMSETQEPT